MEEKTIYELEFHETINIEIDGYEFTIIRVPGGWLYKNRKLVGGVAFVPLSDEFNTKAQS